jgi:rifampin ADP-ribosylating transferase
MTGKVLMTSPSLTIWPRGGLAARPLTCCTIVRPCIATTGVVVASTPVPFEVHESGALLHGTKADLAVGDLLMPGRESNFEQGRIMNHVYVTRTLDAAVWGAELAQGDSPGRIYIVESDGALEDDPNVTDKKFPGNPTRSYRTGEPVRIVGEITDWVGHSPEQLQAMRNRLADLERQGLAVIYD